LITDHSTAVEFELIKLGLRLDWLGTPILTWRDLKVIIKHLPHDSAVNREVNPKHWEWLDLRTQLLAGVLNTLAQGIHLKYGGRRRFDPPVKVPGRLISNRDHAAPIRRKVKGTTITELDSWLAARRAAGKL
jgi:hypothetical protein